MTGNDCLRQAMSLLNYTDTRVDGGVPGGAGVYRHALAYVNQITADLWYIEHDTPFAPLTGLGESLPLSDAAAQTVLPYGVAMLLAQAAGDADNQTLYAGMYDQRRSAARRSDGHILDCLPGVRG